MKRIIATMSVFLWAAFTAWLCGYDFDQRNVLIAYAFVVISFLASLVWILPHWGKEE
jgi:hypothetical protein